MIDIRLANETDLPYLYDICVLTGLAGKDSSPMLSDRFIIGQYYAAPYYFFEKELCFILIDNDIPCGYIVGTSDTSSYNKWFNTSWLLQLRKKYPLTSSRKSDFEKWLVSMINENVSDGGFLNEYPAHLHIDILPAFHGKGYGKSLMERFFEGCRIKNCRGIHLGVSKLNEKALGFYNKIGMNALSEDANAVIMGLKL